MKPTFKEFVDNPSTEHLNEDLDADIVRLQSDISMIDQQIQQRTAPLIARKQQLTKTLLQKQKQRQSQMKQPQQQQQQPQVEPPQ